MLGSRTCLWLCTLSNCYESLLLLVAIPTPHLVMCWHLSESLALPVNHHLLRPVRKSVVQGIARTINIGNLRL